MPIILFTFLDYFLHAQDVSDQSITPQLWLDYNPTFSVSEKVDLYGDIGMRSLFPNEWYRFVVGSSVRYKLSKILFKKLYYKEELHAGIRFFFTANKSASDRLEIRPFQGYKLFWPNRPRIVLQHYLRLEERFDIVTSNWSNTFGLRFRYRVKMILKFKGDWISFNDGLYLPVSMESFMNLKDTEQFNDVVRITPGIGYEFSEFFKAEFDLSYHYTRDTVEDDFATNDIVFRFRVFKNLNQNNTS